MGNDNGRMLSRSSSTSSCHNIDNSSLNDQNRSNIIYKSNNYENNNNNDVNNNHRTNSMKITNKGYK